MRRKSFTLAEVLVTLMIVGIVASLTIPSLLKNYQEKETVSQLLKSYAMLKQATLMITAECDGSVLNCLTDPNAANDDATALSEIAALYKSKLKVIKDCGTGTGCISPQQINYLDGVNEAWLQDDRVQAYKMILNDGKILAFDWYYAGRPYNAIIDLNGKKAPNIYGRDIFIFVYNTITGDIDPVGKDFYQNTCSTSNNGSGCAQKVLLERAINY